MEINVIEPREQTFSEMVKDFCFKEKGIDIDEIDYHDIPKHREQYNFSGVNPNQWRTPAEVDIIVKEYLERDLI